MMTLEEKIEMMENSLKAFPNEKICEIDRATFIDILEYLKELSDLRLMANSGAFVCPKCRTMFEIGKNHE